MLFKKNATWRGGASTFERLNTCHALPVISPENDASRVPIAHVPSYAKKNELRINFGFNYWCKHAQQVVIIHFSVNK